MIKTLLADLKLLFTLTVICLVLILLDHFRVLNLPKAAFQTITIPIQYGVYQSGKSIEDQFKFVFLLRVSSQENMALKKQLNELLVENANLQKTLKESKDLSDQQKFLSKNEFDYIPARVIGIDRYAILDKGSEDGVVTGQVVIYKDNYIGQVKLVSSKVSEVLLPFDPDSKIAVFSQNKQGKAKGILEGQFGSELQMNKILHQETVEAEDLVYSEGTEGKLLRGLIMGRVSKVEERQNEIFKIAQVKPIFTVDQLDVVFIVKN